MPVVSGPKQIFRFLEANNNAKHQCILSVYNLSLGRSLVKTGSFADTDVQLRIFSWGGGISISLKKERQANQVSKPVCCSWVGGG